MKTVVFIDILLSENIDKMPPFLTWMLFSTREVYTKRTGDSTFMPLSCFRIVTAKVPGAGYGHYHDIFAYSQAKSKVFIA